MSGAPTSLHRVKYVADLLAVSEEYVRDHCRLPNPEWEHERLGSGPRPRIRFTDAQVEAIVAQHRRAPALATAAAAPTARGPAPTDDALWARANTRLRRDAA